MSIGYFDDDPVAYVEGTEYYKQPYCLRGREEVCVDTARVLQDKLQRIPNIITVWVFREDTRECPKDES